MCMAAAIFVGVIISTDHSYGKDSLQKGKLLQPIEAGFEQNGSDNANAV